jgi:hypothetical protein
MIGIGCVPVLAVADIDIHTDTIVRDFKRPAGSREVELVLPVYGYLGLDYDVAEQGGLSFHLYGWDRKDSADNDLHMEDPDGELHFGHLGYQKPDNQFEKSGDLCEAKAGADFVLHLGSRLTLTGLSSYNIDSEDWRKHRYEARLRVSHLMIEPSFQYVSYQDDFGKGDSRNNIFHFLQNEEEILAISGTDFVWQGLGGVDIGVRGRHYNYDIRQESALYMAGLLSVSTASGSQIGIEIGRMDGKTADNLYDLYRGYFYWQQPLRIKTQGFISGDALYIAYDAPVYGEDKSIQYSLSAGRRFFDNRMETKLSGIFSQDPYFDSDVGGVVTLHIHY